MKEKVDLDRLEARIAKLETSPVLAKLRQAKRQRRALVAAAASARVRQAKRQDRDIKLQQAYLARERRYGTIEQLAGEFGLTTRQVRRILNRDPACCVKPPMRE